MATALLGSPPLLAGAVAGSGEKNETGLAAARQQVRSSAKKLAAYEIAVSTEPAFVFKP